MKQLTSKEALACFNTYLLNCFESSGYYTLMALDSAIQRITFVSTVKKCWNAMNLKNSLKFKFYLARSVG